MIACKQCYFVDAEFGVRKVLQAYPLSNEQDGATANTEVLISFSYTKNLKESTRNIGVPRNFVAQKTWKLNKPIG